MLLERSTGTAGGSSSSSSSSSSTTTTTYRPKSASGVRGSVNQRRNTFTKKQSSVPVETLATMAEKPETRVRRRRKRPSTAGGGGRGSSALSSAGAHAVLKKSSSPSGRRKRKKRPSTAGALRKSADSNVRTSFPPVKRRGKVASKRSNRPGQENKNNGWMQTSSNEIIQPYDALADKFCPLYKPANLVKGKAGVPSPGSTQYKMKKWRDKYNKELRQSMREVMDDKEEEDENDAARRHHHHGRQETGSPPHADQLREDVSFPFPDPGEEGSLLMFQPTASTLNNALNDGGGRSSASSSSFKASTNITFARTPPSSSTIDEATRNRIRAAGAGAGERGPNQAHHKNNTSSNLTHSQHEVQVVKVHF